MGEVHDSQGSCAPELSDRLHSVHRSAGRYISPKSGARWKPDFDATRRALVARITTITEATELHGAQP